MTRISRHHLREVVSYQQLLAAGLTDDAIRHQVRTGRLHPRHRGVYAVGRPQISREGAWYAAVLACGDGALLSHRSAAALHELSDHGGEWPEVSVPTDHGRRRHRGLTLHRTATLTSDDAAGVAGIAVTTIERTLIDLARIVERRALRAAVRQAERLHHIDLAALRTRVAQPRTNVAHARLFSLLSDYVAGTGRSDSELEALLLELCARHRLPTPATQVPIGAYRPDFVWHAERLIVETDGRETHGTAVAFVEDRVRDRALTAAGYEVLRFTWAEVTDRPGGVAREIRAALARRGRDFGGGGAKVASGRE